MSKRKLKEQFAAELEPLLHDAEKAILASYPPDPAPAMKMLVLVQKYSTMLDRETIREVLNGPTATAIFERLNLRRQQ